MILESYVRSNRCAPEITELETLTSFCAFVRSAVCVRMCVLG
jgi:hypothetical protein